MFNTIFPRKTALPGAGTVIGGKNIKLVFGLGNPGEEYRRTYHNAGAIFVDHLMRTIEPTTEGKDWKQAKSFTYIKFGSLVVIKPREYMNRAGKSVREALRYFSVRPEEILVAHDDSDLVIGTYKISYGRGSAGHRGIESIIKALKGSEFTRLRIGIRSGGGRAGDFVLDKIKNDEFGQLEKLFGEIETTNFEA